jgi:hypothetical protein
MRAGGFLIALSACAASAPAGLYFPTYSPLDQQPGGVQEGTLRRDGPCLYIESPDSNRLALWSSDLRAVEEGGEIAIADRGGGILAREAVPAIFGGADYGPEHQDFLEELLGDEIDPDCRQDRFFLVVSIPSELQP